MPLLLDDLLARIDAMDPATKQQLVDQVDEATANLKWMPNPGPQTDAYFTEADILFYGGQGGGGKTDLGLGLAFNEHHRTLCLRRKYVDLSGLTDRAKEINGRGNQGFNGSAPPKLTVDSSTGQLIEFGAAQKVGDEWSWQGRAHDFMYVDEAVHFAESQIRFLMGWLRSAKPGQRCRVVLGSNPPLSEEGEWIIRWFAPWIDPQYTGVRALPGELRWYVTDGGEDFEVDGPGDYLLGEDDVWSLSTDEDALTALSRTFIPAKLRDNPQLMKDKQYKAQQDRLPEHLRNAIRDGNFSASRRDHDGQLIPSEWIKDAQDRWTERPPEGVPMCAVGVDPTGGGSDFLVVQPRHDWYFAEATKIPAKKVPMGKDIAGEVIKVRRDDAQIIIDMGGGYGTAPYEQLTAGNVDAKKVTKYKGSEAASGRSLHSQLRFYNTRAMAYYRLYEALDPNQPGGSQIALPPSQTLYADLCSIRWHNDPEDQLKIQLEPKKKLTERIGRSTDEGDAVVMAWHKGLKGANIQGGWSGHRQRQRPQVVMGRGSRTGRARR